MLYGWQVEDEKKTPEEHVRDAIAMYIQHQGELPKVVKAKGKRLDFTIPEDLGYLHFEDWDQANANIYYVGYDDTFNPRPQVVDTEAVEEAAPIISVEPEIILEIIEVVSSENLCPPADKMSDEAKQLSRGFRGFLKRR